MDFAGVYDSTYSSSDDGESSKGMGIGIFAGPCNVMLSAFVGAVVYTASKSEAAGYIATLGTAVCNLIIAGIISYKSGSNNSVSTKKVNKHGFFSGKSKSQGDNKPTEKTPLVVQKV